MKISILIPGILAVLTASAFAEAPEGGHPMIVKPTPQQLAWQEDELSMFIHFGTNTFTNREWGEGTEDPRVFNPSDLDAGQWARIAKAAGFKLMILSTKHHDGLCLWPSRYTEHSIKASPWKSGKGDVMREFSDACRKEGLKVGFYLSPWDRNSPYYGYGEAYNRHFKNQLKELLTGYGEITEVWFDGACGEGPNGKKQEYDWQGYYETVRKYQPNALIAISGPDIRWVGNEDGVARETEWSVQDANPTLHGKTGKVWWPAECDVSIRPGWFWHKTEDDKVKSLDQLTDIYFKSVGRNSVLLLNVPPNDRGLISEPDEKRLMELRAALDRIFAVDLAKGKPVLRDGAHVEIDLAKPTEFNVVMLQEDIAQGQRVEEYRIEALSDGSWIEIAKGTTIGHKKLDRFPTVTASRVRLTITRSQGAPLIRTFGLLRAKFDKSSEAR